MSKEGIVFETSHGSTLFPLEVVLNESDALNGFNKDFIYCHWHKHTEFIYVEKGTAIFNINGSITEASQGQAVFINPEELHSAYAAAGCPCRLYATVFDMNMLSFTNSDYCQENVILPFINGRYNFPRLLSGSSASERDIITNIIKIQELYFIKSKGYELKIKALLYLILVEISAMDSFNPPISENITSKQQKIDKLKKLLVFIDDNYSRKLKVDELAGFLGMSTDHFYKFFKSRTGKTPVEYINWVRINRAAELIYEQHMTVLEAGLSVGFENISYFIKTFKKYKHHTPGRLRCD